MSGRGMCLVLNMILVGEESESEIADHREEATLDSAIRTYL